MNRTREIAVGVTIALLATTATVLAAASPEAGATCDAPTQQIWTAAADGTGRASVSDADAGTDPVNNVRGQWSPDGTRIVWDGLDAQTLQLYVADADGAGRTQLTTGTDPSENRRAQWSPDGTRLAFVASDGASDEIFVSAADGTGRVLISDGGVDDPTGNLDPQWSPDGTRIAWSGLETTEITGSIDPDGTTTVTGVGTLFTTELVVGDTITVKGETRTVTAIASDLSLTVEAAFSDSSNDTTVGRGRVQIYAAAADGTGRIRVSSVSADPDPTGNTTPEWSPDGTRLAWSGNDEILVANADGTDRTEISDVGGGGLTANRAPQWSPDGTRLAWSGNDGTFAHIHVANADGTGRARISDVGGVGPTNNGAPQWSPDGTKLAWDGDEGPTNHIYVAAADGTGRTRVSDVSEGSDPVGNRSPQWSPDGTRLLWDGLEGPCLPPPTTTTTSTTSTSTSTTSTSTTTTSTTTTSTTTTSTTTTTTTIPVPTVEECPTDSSPFTDIDSSFAHDAIECIFGLEIAAGNSPSTYGPVLDVTRQEMAAFLARLWRRLGGVCSTDPAPLIDIGTSFARTDIDCLYALKVTRGNTPATYGPLLDVTREEMAAFLARLWRELGGTCSTDPAPLTDIAASFARVDIDCLYALGITSGKTATTYGPELKVSREEMAAFLARLWRAAVALP